MKRLIPFILILVLFYTRYVTIGWGLPYPMHPDERNMAVAIEQLSCPPLSSPTSHLQSPITNHQSPSRAKPLTTCLNPHFFAYGQFPLYLAYGGIVLYHSVSHTVTPISFDEATLALRTLSALASVLLVFVLYKTVLLFIDKKHTKSSLLKVCVFTFFIFSPFAIQFAHFGTTESFLMLFYSSILYFCLLLLKKEISTTKFIVITGILSGLSLGTKTSSALFLGLPIISIFFKMVGGTGGGDPNGAHIGRSPRSTGGEESRGRIYHFFFILAFFLLFTLICFCLSSPQSFLNWNDFISSMTYESSIGMGKYIPFYTRQFVNTTPLLFQIKNILPYALGWPQFILGILGFFLLPLKTKTKQQVVPVGGRAVAESVAYAYANSYNILRLALLIVFLPNAFFFAKWTRFIAPVFSLFSLCAALFLYQLFQIKKTVFVSIVFISLVPGIAYLSIYRALDIRFIASNWIYKNIPTGSKILSETANVVDIPIPSTSSSNPENKYFQIASFNFYDLDASPELQKELPLLIQSADYIIIPSRRIFKNHSRETYPVLNDYYEKLFSGEWGFEKVAEFSSYPNISLFGKTIVEFPDENAEETWTVFDHPVIRIYKKITNNKYHLSNQKTDFSNYQITNYQLPSPKGYSPLSGKTTDYQLLIADTSEKWEKGLMYVKNKQDIGGLDGMIFTFPDSQVRTFWNKNTLSDLTLYWIEKGKVVGTSDMPSITKTDTIVTFPSPSSVDTVIEIVK